MQNVGAFGNGRRRYNQKALVAVFLFGGITFLSAVAMVVCGVVVARPMFWARNFENTTCTVVGVEQRGEVQCSCGSSSSRGSGQSSECFSSYPCVAVHVKYNYTTGKDLVESSSTLVHENEVTGIDESECSAVPECSTSFYMNNKSVYEFIGERGQMNESYSCFYNPENFVHVIFRRIFTHLHATLALAIPSAFFVVGVIGTIYATIALMSKSKLAEQSNNFDGTGGGIATNYPTNTGVNTIPPPPPSNTLGYGDMPPPAPPTLTGMQSYGVNAAPPAYTPNPYGGLSANYPRIQ